ncbi:hypothetical protein [Sphingobacterium sp.]|uniref:hypothetical protein n=1 Tax=Sphingobacterium sp. TaxID=341027 RepID=UPI0028A2A439|nr:hypothetical protein [Sphingobacterium sp.]
MSRSFLLASNLFSAADQKRLLTLTFHHLLIGTIFQQYLLHVAVISQWSSST